VRTADGNILFYDTATGGATLERVDRNGSADLQTYQFSGGWTHLVQIEYDPRASSVPID
jgi:hypothetical protein